jgi:RNA polymerase sigma-70 factor (ECF subfamily)
MSPGTSHMLKWKSAEAPVEAAAEPASRHEIFAEYHGRVYGFFKSRGFPSDDARELTQETLVRVFQNMGDLRSRASLESWILKIAANVWKNEIRYRQAAKRSAVQVSLDDPEADREAIEIEGLTTQRVPSALDRVLASERLAAVERCLDAMPPGMRRCLVLHVFQDRKYQEIADLLQLSIQSVKSHIHQARRHLCECVVHRLAGGGP